MLSFLFPTLSQATANLISWPFQICPHVSTSVTTITIPVTSTSQAEVLLRHPCQLQSISHPAHVLEHRCRRQLSMAAGFPENKTETSLAYKVQAFPLSLALGHPHPESPVHLPHPCHMVLSQFLIHTKLFPASESLHNLLSLPSLFSFCELSLRTSSLGLDTQASDPEKVSAPPGPLLSSISFAPSVTILRVSVYLNLSVLLNSDLLEDGNHRLGL